MKPAFLYGLFMDVSALREMGLSPEIAGHAKLRGYRIHVADRATLIPAEHSIVYGVLVRLTQPELNTLYSPPTVADYRPTEVEVTCMEGGRSEIAIVYNLPKSRIGSDRNQIYANNLASLVRKLGFPPAYAQEIEVGA